MLFIGSAFEISAQQDDYNSNSVPGPIFNGGEAQVVPEFSYSTEWLKEELWVETTFDSDNDGKLDRMHVFVTRPYQTDSQELKLPVIYESSPYYGMKIWSMISSMIWGDPKKHLWNVKHELGETPKPHKHPNHKTRAKRPVLSMFSDINWVPRGYIMVYSSSPGTGLSDGAPTVGGDNEAMAPKAVIDWLCGRAKGYRTRTGNEEVKAFWSNGKVGMTGTSYDGTLCIAAATTGVEGLEAIIPVAPVSSFYDYYRSNGLVRSPGGFLGEDMDVLYDIINTGDKSKRDYGNSVIRDSFLANNIDRETGDYNEFWATRDYTKKVDLMKAPMLMSHGFNDWNVMPSQSYKFYQAVKEKGIPVQLYYHQDGHGGPPPLSMMNRWFTKYLHGIENGVENDSPVQIVREREQMPTSYDSYPDENAQEVTLYLTANNSSTGRLSMKMPKEQDKEVIIDDYSIAAKKLIEEKHEEHRLLYLTPLLEKDLRLSGITNITINLACDKPAANLSVWLVSLPWQKGKKVEIYDNIITRGWADPQNHSSLTNGAPLVPGEFYQVSFDLMPDDQVIPAGQQIGLLIFSSDKEFTIHPDKGTKLTIDPNLTRITLPIVGGLPAYENAIKSKSYGDGGD